MLFKEIIPANSKNHETYKYKIHNYWLLNQVVYIVTSELQRVKYIGLHVASSFSQRIPT
jgi:hypothetical protein